MLFLTVLGLPVLAKPGLPAPQQTPAVPLNHIVAVVNETIITQSDLNKATYSAKQQFAQHGAKIPNEKELRNKVLEGLIYQKLQLQLASQNKISASDKQVDDTIENIAKQNHINISTLKEKLKQEHLNFDEFKSQIRDQITVNTLQQQALAGKVHLDAKNLETFKQKFAKQNSAAEYHVVDYLVALPENSTGPEKKNALGTAQNVLAALKSNNKVPNQATENDMGWLALQQIPDLFASAIVHLPEGGVAGPFLAGNGYHVVKLIDTKQSAPAISDDQARQLMYQEKYQVALKKWLDGLKATTYVKVYD